MGNEPSKRSMAKTGGHDMSISNGQRVDKTPRDDSLEVSGFQGSSDDLGKIDILQSDSTTTNTKTLLEVANGLHVTDNVSSITTGESVDNTVQELQDNHISSSVHTGNIKESSTDDQTETLAPPCGSADDQTDTPPTTPRKDTPTTPGRDDSGVESSSDIVQVGRSSGGSKDSKGTKSKISKKSKKLENSKKMNKSTSQINIDEAIEDEVVSSKKDKKKKLKKKISKQSSIVSDVGMTSTVSMSSGLNVSSVSSDAGRGTLERSVSSVEPGFGVVNSNENKKPRRPLSKSFSDIEQQKEKKKKKKVDKKKSSVVSMTQVPVENTNKEKRRSIFEEDFTVELGLAEENLDVVSLSSLSSDDENIDLENRLTKGNQWTANHRHDNEEIVKSTFRSTSKSSITLKDSPIEEQETNDNTYDHIVYERKITVLKHEQVLSENDCNEANEQNKNQETEPPHDIGHEEIKIDALKQDGIETSEQNDKQQTETIHDISHEEIKTDACKQLNTEPSVHVQTDRQQTETTPGISNEEVKTDAVKYLSIETSEQNDTQQTKTTHAISNEEIKTDAVKYLSIETSEQNDTQQTETTHAISHEEIKVDACTQLNTEASVQTDKQQTETTHDEEVKKDALKQLSIDYSSEGEEVDEVVDDVLGNYSLVDQIVAHVSREYCCAPQEILTDRKKNGVRRIGHSQSMSPTEGGKLHRPVRRQCSEDVTRTRLGSSHSPDGYEGDFHDHPRRVILTRPLSFDYPSSSSSSFSAPKPSKKRQNSFSEMLKKSTTALTHHRRKSETKGELLKEQNVGKARDGQATSIVYM